VLKVCINAKLPEDFAIPTLVENYSSGVAMAFNEGAVNHTCNISKVNGKIESQNPYPVENSNFYVCSSSASNVKFHDEDNYQNLLSIMNSL